MIDRSTSFIKATNQIWKLILSLSIGIITFVLGCFSIKCPKCKIKILYFAISKVDHDKWISWLFAFTICPKCEYEPIKE